MKRVQMYLGCICLVMLLFPLLCMGQDQNHLEKVSLQLQWKHQFEFAGFYAALEKGYYTEAGLEVEIREYDKNIDIIGSVLSEEATFGTLYSTAIRARMEGKPIILLANYFKRSPLAIVTKPDIYFPVDLKGKKVMGEKHEFDSANFAMMFGQFNMSTDDFVIVPHTYNVDKFVKNDVDAMTVFLTNEVYHLRREKVPYNVIDPNNYGVPLYDVTIFASESFARKKPSVVRSFIDASNRGWEYAMAHPEEIVDLIIEKYNSQNKSKEHLLFEADQSLRMVQPDIYPIGSIDPNRIKRIEELFISEGVATKIVEPESFIFGAKQKGTITLTPQEEAFIRIHPALKVIRSFHQPPFAVHQENSTTGYLYDLLNDVIRIAGFDVQYIEGLESYDEMVEAVSQGTADILPNMNSTRQLPDSIVRTAPVVTTPNVLVAKVSAPDVKDTGVLFDKKVAVVKGYAQDQYLSRFPQITKVHVASNSEGFEAVRMGKAEYFLNNLANSSYTLEKTFATDLKISGALSYEDFPPLVLSFAINQKHPELPAIIKKALDQVPFESRSRLRRKWLHKEASTLQQEKNDINLTREEKQWIGESHVIRVANETDWPPFDFAENGIAKGYSIDLLKLIAEKIGLRLDFVNGYTWDALMEMGKRKQVDLFPAIWKTRDREQYLNFSAPYIDTPHILIVHKDEKGINTIDDLEGRTLAGIKGFASTDIVKKHYPNIRVVEVINAAEGLRMVSYGNADAYLGSYGESDFEIRKHLITNLKIAGETTLGGNIPASQLHIAVRKDWPIPHRIIQKGLAAVTPEEKLSLKAKWIQLHVNPKAIFLSDEERNWIKEHPVIKVSNETDYPPFDFAISGKPMGYTIDLLDLLAKRVGIRIEYINGYTWDELVQLFRERKLDLLHSLVKTPERSKFMLFSDRFFRDRQMYITRKETPDITDVTQLYGKTISQGKNWSTTELFQANYPQIPLLIVKNLEEMLSAVAYGKVDATVADEAAASYMIKQKGMSDLKLSGWAKEFDQLVGLNFHFAAQMDAPELISMLNKALASLTTEELDGLRRKWFGEEFATADHLENNGAGIPLEKNEQLFLKGIQEVTYCVDPDWMPFERINEYGSHEGMMADLMKDVERRLGIKLRLVPTHSWSETLLSVREGRCQLISAAAETTPRKEYLDFSKPHGEYPLVVAVRNEELFVENLAAIRDKTLGVVKDYAHADLIREKYPNFKIIEVNNVADGLQRVLDQEIYGFVDTIPTIGYTIRRQGIANLKIGGKLDIPLKLAIGVHKGEPPELLSILNKVLDSFTAEEKELLAEKWFSIKIEKIFDYTRLWQILAGVMVIFLAILFWIRKLTRLNRSLKFAQEAADKANRSKSEFLANMSHELRTPLNAILGFSELMKRDHEVSPDQRKNLETIGRSGEHLLSLINDVLEFSKIEAGRMGVNEKNFDLHRLLLGLEEMFRLRASQKGLSLTLRRSDDVPQFICTDKNKLRQILINLLGNAIKYTNSGEISLSVTVVNAEKQSEPDTILLHFMVEDTGIGISEEEQGKIFDAFFQTGDQRASRQGTGLGLPISQKFVELLGGKLQVQSKEGKGTSFSFLLPVKQVDAGDTKTSGIDMKVVGLASGQPQFRILVVEDNENNRTLLTTLLRTIGLDVEEAVNGREALEKWREYHPHLIWMDMRMPVMDGYDATERIKAEMQDTGSETKIIALTASAFEEDRMKVMEHGGDDFVRKPFKESEIFEMMHKHLGVQYVFVKEEADQLQSGVPMSSHTSLKSEIEALPDSIVNKLITATELSDTEKIHQAIEEIRESNALLADALNDLAENFAYDQILTLIGKNNPDDREK